MRAHGTATRRFYNAFYRWTVLLEAPHSSARGLATSTRQLASDNDTTRGAGARYPSLPTAYKDKHLERQPARNRSIKASEPRSQSSSQPAETSHDADPLPSIIHGEVRGPQERPFSSMQPWEEVVRYKSFAGFSIEVCMPEQIITQIEQQGPLQSLLNLPDLQIDVGQTVINRSTTGVGVPVRSVLCSGTVENIEVMRNKFSQLQARLAALDGGDAAMGQQGEGSNVVSQDRENYTNIRSPKQPLPHETNREDVNQQRNANHAAPQNRSHRTVGRTENDSRIAPKTTGDPTIEKDTEGTESQGHNIYVLDVQPQMTSDPNEVPLGWQHGILEQLQELRNRLGIQITNFSPVTRLKGPLASIKEARQALQSIVDQKCDRMSIPRRQLMEVMPPTQSAKAKVLLRRRVKEAKQDKTKVILRPLAHPVVLVLAATRDIDYGSNAIDHMRGVTVSSLTSVTMAPDPIVSFNIRLPSRTWDAIQANPKICINLLEASREGATVAHAFTQPHEDPTEGFRKLGRLGYVLRGFGRHDAKRLMKVDSSGIRHPDCAIFGVMAATVNAKSCVKIGDHAIVVAQVQAMLMSETNRKRAEAGESFGLTYANREYRIPGSTIEPMHIPEEGASQMGSDPVVPDASEDVVTTHNGDQARLQEVYDSLDMTEAPENDFHKQPFVSENAIGTNQPIDGPIVTSADGAIRHREEELNALPTTQALNTPNVEQTYQSLEQLESAGTMDHDAPAMHDKSSSHPAPTQPFIAQASTNNTSASNLRPSSNSSMSFLKRMWRSYSTSTKPSIVNEAHPETSTTAEANQLKSKVSDKSLLTVTVGDFLNSHDDEFHAPRRMRAMMNAKKQSDLASKELERALANGTLTAEQSKHLEDIITRNDRWLAKKLAFHSAYDLRLMLDRGKVDVRLSQWLERSIEKGQAVLLEEVRHVQALYDNGKLKEEKYKIVKEDLERDTQILATEAMRLRQMVNDEADEVGAAPEREGFDGFKGNL